MYTAALRSNRKKNSSAAANSVGQRKRKTRRGFHHKDKQPSGIKSETVENNDTHPDSGRLHNNRMNSASPVQRIRLPLQREPEKNGTKADSNPADLSAMIKQLELLKADAIELGKGSSEAPGLAEMAKLLDNLKKIDNGDDEGAKAEALSLLREELTEVPAEKGEKLPDIDNASPPLNGKSPVQKKTIQRLGWLAITGIVAGSGLVILGVYGFVRSQLNRRERERAQRRREDLIFDLYYSKRNKEVTGLNEWGAIPAEISDGVATQRNNAAKATRLFNNLNAFRFNYTGRFVNANLAFLAKRGDCQTLVDMYYLAAQKLGITSVNFRDRVGNQLAPAHRIHGRSVRGNTEGETHWFFQEHFWIDVGGQTYDLLFMTQNPPQPSMERDTEKYRGVEFIIFQNNKCFLNKNQTAKLDVDFRSEGIVKDNATAMRTYIDTHYKTKSD